ncbi:hypothetical protein QBC37DRAFT_455555 [Rhypophila decipiens]|uniref:Ubiquitin carboxyl-terminal hydrolase n=1 Tax=Rhypophila decipiens TaxID=261697 RepID=A0AAN7BA20_9PEZI|nr:hypothetical protein QBC37DRAFT_455555 [Rhypophila decipiens]
MVRSAEPEQSGKPEPSSKPAEEAPAARRKLSPGRRSSQISNLSVEAERSSKSAEGQPAGQSEPPSRRSGQIPEIPEMPTLRRSARARVVSSKVTDSDERTSLSTSNPGASSPPPVKSRDVRRNPKRKATPEVYEDTHDKVLEASLEPWKENERDDWPSWAEVESNPDHFNRIFSLLGVKRAKLQELVSTDVDTLACLPKPVYGLIFLSECGATGAHDVESEPVKPPPDLWFAKQTTTNACGTVALFNIFMNAEGLPLGERLENFKHECKFLSPALRGYLLSQSTWIRATANSFSRRLDLLDAALGIQNQVDESKKRQTKKRKIVFKDKTRPSSGGSSYHFVAYVPSEQKVWQLDGLVKKPECVGEYQKGEAWTDAVCNVLAAHMLQSGDDSFSLLALTGNPSGDTEAEVDSIPGGKKDHTLGIHQWVKTLAEHGVLKELHDKVKRAKES